MPESLNSNDAPRTAEKEAGGGGGLSIDDSNRNDDVGGSGAGSTSLWNAWGAFSLDDNGDQIGATNNEMQEMESAIAEAETAVSTAIFQHFRH